MPFIYAKEIREADVLRGSQLTSTIPCIVSKIIFGKKFVFNYAYDHAEFSKIEGDVARALILKLWEVIAVRLADGITAATSVLKNRLQNINKNTIYSPNGVDLDLFKIKKKQKNKTTRLLFVGRLEKQKNLENFLLGVKRLNRKNVEVEVIGEGSLKAKLERLAKSLGLNVVFLPYIENEKLLKVLFFSLFFLIF